MKRQVSVVVRGALTQKHREICFAKLPIGQLSEAARLLASLEGVSVTEVPHRYCVIVEYDLLDYNLHGLEEGLSDQGFHLDNSLLVKLMRAFNYYAEEIQLHNLHAPERLIKTYSKEAYASAWDRHMHGDHDDTPSEWREYK